MHRTRYSLGGLVVFSLLLLTLGTAAYVTINLEPVNRRLEVLPYYARTYINILYGLGDKIEPLVKKYLKKSLSIEKLMLLIELAGTIPLRSLYPDIMAFADHPEKEIRIKVARALGQMRIPTSLDILIKLSDDEAWEVSAQAMKSLGKLGDLKAKDVLSKGMFSPFWHVRFNAGHGLANLGDLGIKHLQKVKKQKKDAYASDMANMVLDEVFQSGEA